VSSSAFADDAARWANQVSEEERLAHATLDALSAHVALLDERGEILTVNAAWREFAEANGSTRASWSRGVGYLDICDRAAPRCEEAARIADGIRALLDGRARTFEVEYPCHGPQKRRWFVARGTLLPGDGPARVVLAHEEVSARKLSEERLAEAEARYRTLVENLPLGAYVNGADESVPVVYISPQIELLTGYTAEEMTSRPDFFPGVLHPDDRERVLGEHAQAFATGKPLRTEYRVVARDGRVVWFQDEGTIVVNGDGEPYLHGFVLDVTQRKKAEDELRVALETVAALVEASPVAIVAYDTEGVVSRWNTAAERLFGWSADEVVGAFSPLNLDTREQFEADLARVLSGESWSGVEVTRRRKDGSHVELSASSGPLRDARNEIIGMVSFHLDITERKRTEEELRRTSETLGKLIEASPLPIVAFDEAGLVTLWNPAAESTFGWSEPEVLGRANPLVPEEEQAAFSRALELNRLGKSWRNVEVRRRRKDGTPIDVSASSAPLRGTHDEVVGMVSVLSDVTEKRLAEEKLRRAEEQYRLLVEQLPLVVYIDSLDETSSTIYVSPQIEALVGYGPDEWLNDRRMLEKLLHPEDRERVMAEIRRTLASGEPFDCEYRLVAKDGTVVWIQDEDITVYDEAGNELYAQGFMLDITARKAAESEIQRQNERLRELDRLKDEFIALISHELRTPLTSILGYLELLLDAEAGPITEEQEHFLRIIARNSDRLRRLVGDLLLVAQIEAGRLSLDQAEVDLARLAAECVEAAVPAAEERGISVRLSAESVPNVWADRSRLAQLLDNLLSNAIKFTPAGGRVGVALVTRGDNARLEVSDTGIGIPEAERDRLFERFFRTEGATRSAVQGTGLGLAITKAIVEGHGGRIGLESREGVGTTFWVELPLLAGEGRDQSFRDHLHRAA